MMRVLVCVLAHNDPRRLRCALRSARSLRPDSRVAVEVRAELNWAIPETRREAIAVCDSLGVSWSISDSNGWPGRGKNACLDALLASDCDYLTQLDGDDIWYPTLPAAIAEALVRAPALDLLALIPVDQIVEESREGAMLPGRTERARLWGVSAVWPEGWRPGPAPDPNMREPLSTCPAMPRLFSRRAARLLRFAEDLAVGEDHLLLYAALALAQRGALRAWTSMSSDWMCIDRTAANSVQHLHPQERWVEPMRKRALGMVSAERSNIGELPMMFPGVLQTVAEKLRHLTDMLGESSA